MNAEDSWTYIISVGAVKWNQSHSWKGREDGGDDGIYVQIIVDGSPDVHRTSCAEAADWCWDENFTIIGNSLSIVQTEVKSSKTHSSSENLCIGRVNITLGRLLEACADNNEATLDLIFAPVASDIPTHTLLISSSTSTRTELGEGLIWWTLWVLAITYHAFLICIAILKCRVGSKHCIPDVVGSLTVKLCRVSCDVSDPPEKEAILAELSQQMAGPELRITGCEEAEEDPQINDDISISAGLDNASQERSPRLGDLSDLSDFDTASATSQEAVLHSPNDHTDKAYRLSRQGLRYRLRFARSGDPADLVKAIAKLQRAVSLTPGNDPDKPYRFSTLGNSYQERFERLGDPDDLENAIANYQEAVNLIPGGHNNKPAYLANLGVSYQRRFDRLGNLDDLEAGISNAQMAVEYTPKDDPDKPVRLSNLGISYHTRFERQGNRADLEKAVETLQEAVVLTPDGHPDKAARLAYVGEFQGVAFVRYRDTTYYNKGLSSLQSAAQSSAGQIRILLQASRSWARLSLASGDIQSALNAFRTAVVALPQFVFLGMDISSLQGWLAGEEPENLGCMAAACAIRLGRFEEAVELLDLSRAVYWQQESSVKSDLEEFKAVHPTLAEELQNVCRSLDASSFSDLASASKDVRSHESQMEEHQRLIQRRDSLMKEIWTFPWFAFFLKPRPFDKLRPPVEAGHVVIINVSKLGVDALIFDHESSIRHVPLPELDMAGITTPVHNGVSKQSIAEGGNQQVVRMQPSSVPDVQAVWEKIILPIFRKIGIMPEDAKRQRPRHQISWYLTGPLQSVPVDTAGDTGRLVLSSNVTTLAALARRPAPLNSRTTWPKSMAIGPQHCGWTSAL